MSLEVLLEKIKELGVRHGVAHLLLVGSAARKENTILSMDGKEIWLSDLEFFVIMKYSRDRLNFQNAINELQASLDLGIHFSIDLSFMTQRQARNLGCRFLTYEAKHTGVDVLGGMKGFLPDYSVWDIDSTDLHMTIVWRLYKIGKLLAVSSPIMPAVDYTYILARNLLDVLSVELYSQGISITSYSGRLEYCISQRFTFPDLDLAVYEAATEFKLTPNLRFVLTPNYVIKEFLNLHYRLLKRQRSNSLFEPNKRVRLLRRLYSSLLSRQFSSAKFSAAFNGADQGLSKFFGVFKTYLEAGTFSADDFYDSLIMLSDSFDFIADDLDDSIFKS